MVGSLQRRTDEVLVRRKRHGRSSQIRMRWREYRSILAQAGQAWTEHDAARMAAALSFYAILALAPILVIAVTITAAFIDASTLRETLASTITESLGKGASELVASIIDRAATPSNSIPATFIAVMVAMFAASGLFGQIVASMEDMWGIKHEGNALRLFLIGRLKSIAILLVFLVLFLSWVAADSILGWLLRTSGGFAFWPLVSFGASSVFASLVFGLTFRSIPKGRALWRDVWPGACTAGLGFSLAKYLLSLYFSYSGVAAAYGSAGALLVILLWIYYSAQIFFFGAEITRVVALRRRPKPAKLFVPSG